MAGSVSGKFKIRVTDLRRECYGPQSRWAREVEAGNTHEAVFLVGGAPRVVAYGAGEKDAFERLALKALEQTTVAAMTREDRAKVAALVTRAGAAVEDYKSAPSFALPIGLAEALGRLEKAVEDVRGVLDRSSGV